MEYLKEHTYIPKGTWFDDDEFEELLQWGVAYADHTGKNISAGFGISIDWDIDGSRHFYHPDSIWVAAIEGVWGDRPQGTLTSGPSTIPSGTLSFLIAGGSNFQIRVEFLVSGN